MRVQAVVGEKQIHVEFNLNDESSLLCSVPLITWCVAAGDLNLEDIENLKLLCERWLKENKEAE